MFCIKTCVTIIGEYSHPVKIGDHLGLMAITRIDGLILQQIGGWIEGPALLTAQEQLPGELQRPLRTLQLLRVGQRAVADVMMHANG